MAWQGYKVVSKLGEGGMATVYKAIQESLQRPVAIKILAANMKELPEIEERFENESLIIAQLNHPHIIHVIDRGLTSKGRPYFVMEYVEGLTLEECINRGKLNFNQKIDTLVQVCKALTYAHKNGVIHRDIKPANILIDGEWQARMADFGIAHFYESKDGNPLHVNAQNFLGTTSYMAPELEKKPDAVSVQSDLYSLGILMYELFTGVCPQGNIPPPRHYEPDLPTGLNDLIMRCLDADPSERPRSADDMKNVLLHLSQGGHLSQEQKDRAQSVGQGIEAQFALLDVLKENKYCSVYLYEDITKKKLLVVKKLHGNTEGLKENKLLSRLHHQSVAAVVGVSGGINGMTLISEYLSGGSLAERMLSPIGSLQMMDWAEQIAEGLAFAHRNRVIHGNLRPSNVLLNELQQVKLTDFGLHAHYRQTEDRNWFEDASLEGTLGDLYGLGAICFYALTGRTPQFRGGRLIRNKKFSELHQRVQEIIERLLEKTPSKQYPNTEVALADLKGIVRKLQHQQQKHQQEKIQLSVTKVAKQLERESQPLFSWKIWLLRLLIIALIAEEVVYGKGMNFIQPYLGPYLEKLASSEFWIRWRGLIEQGIKWLGW
jgi:serine/threonine protein kinase